MAASFNQVAEAIGAIGSPLGWECPGCNSLTGVKVRRDGEGARCANCSIGYSVAGYYAGIVGVSIHDAVVEVGRIASGPDKLTNQEVLL